jgi:hypothetical protein
MSNAHQPHPATIDTVLNGPAVLTGARSFAAAVICPDGWPTTAEQLPVLVLAADMSSESFQQRGTPPRPAAGPSRCSTRPPNPVPTDALTLLCRGFYGNAAIRRAYADRAHTRFGRYQDALADNGVDLVQITHPHAAGKTAPTSA